MQFYKLLLGYCILVFYTSVGEFAKKIYNNPLFSPPGKRPTQFTYGSRLSELASPSIIFSITLNCFLYRKQWVRERPESVECFFWYASRKTLGMYLWRKNCLLLLVHPPMLKIVISKFKYHQIYSVRTISKRFRCWSP